MDRKEIFFSLVLILVIFAVGFFLRIESTEMHGLNGTEKQFFTDNNGLPYFYEFDGYFYYRITENYLNNGHLGDQIKNNQSWDSYSTYPPGKSTDSYSVLIVWVTLLFYFISNLFVNMSLLEICFWIPAFIAPLAGIIGYLLVRKYVGETGAFITGILLVTAPIYFMRTVPGFFDTDMFNILLPLLTVWFFSEALETHEKRYMIFNVFLSSLSLLLFSFAWGGWSYLLYIMILAAFVYILSCKIKGLNIKRFIKIFLLFLGFLIFLMLITTGLSGLASIIDRPLVFILSLQGNFYDGAWPNILLSVAELGKPSLNEFISELGPINLGLGFFGFILISSVMLRKKMRSKYLPKFSWFIFILLICWLFVAILSYMSSIRFGLMVVLPLAIFSGIFVGVIIKYLENSPINKSNKKITWIIAFIFIFIIILPPIINITDSYAIFTPRADDDMMSAALWINANTSNDTEVITDWSYSYFITAFAKRPVLVDGGSQNSPRTYWLHKSFATDNETLSIGIMRMLSSSGDESYLLLENNTHNTSLTVKIMENILGLPKKEAKQVLINKYGLDENLSNKILNGTHPSKNPNFVVFTNDAMVKAIYWVFYYGDWNFDLEKNEYLYSFGRNSSFNNSPEVIKYNNGVVLYLNNNKALWNGKTPYCIILSKNGSHKTYYLNNKSNFCIIFPSDYKTAIIIDKKYVNSVFVKLVLLKQPTKYFKPIYKKNSVIIWKPNY